MATMTAFLVPDYTNTVSVSNTTASLAAPGAGLITTTAAPLTFGKRRILHIVAINTTANNSRAAVSYTLGLSTGVTAPTPTTSSPFFMGDEGITIDLGDSFDQIQLGNDNNKNGAAAVAYSVSVMAKF
jgi:hypothetical protein